MKCCPICFNALCRHDKLKIEIDYYMYPAIYELNRKGYNTVACCSGHEDNGYCCTYVLLSDEVDFDFESDYAQFDTYSYNGVHVRKNKIQVSPDIAKQYKKKRTNKLGLLQTINRDFYRIAREAPIKNLNSNIEERLFDDSYFDDESFVPEIIDVQNPWMVMIPKREEGIDLLDEYLRLNNLKETFYEGTINCTGLYNKLSSNDFTYREDAFSIVEKVKYDISSGMQLIHFGADKDLQIERIFVQDETWYLSYVNIGISSNNMFRYAINEDKPPLYVAEEISDYIYDNQLVESFEKGFHFLVEKDVHICIYSSKDTFIVFSNCIDFIFASNEGGMALFLGPVEYEETEYKHYQVAGAEMFIFYNGMLLLRKEV